MTIFPSNVYLVEILKPVARMPLEMYVQEATLSHDKRLFYVSRGSAGHLCVSTRSCKVLACRILYSSSLPKEV